MERIDAPGIAEADAAPPRAAGALTRIVIRSVSAASCTALFGAALAAIALTWVLYERVLPLSGALGFWMCTYLAFLLMYAGVSRTQVPGRVVVDRVVTVLVASAGLLVLAIVLDQIGYVVFRGWDAIRHENFVSQTMSLAGPLDPLTSGGMLHALVGSLEQMAIATVVSVPLGVFAALFLVEVGGPLARPVRTIVEAMTALPEIIAGLFIYAFVVLSLGIDQSGFAAALALTVMMIPIVTRSAEVILRLVPGGLREASYALGASQVRTVFTVVLPTARSGLATAVILAMARAVGETSPVLLTAGFTSGMNADPFSGPQVSLPLYIYSYVRFPQPTMVARAFGAGLALMVMVLVLFALARLVGGKTPGELSKRQMRRMQRVSGPAVESRAVTTDPQLSEG
ncbi:MAG TPA: phosphate ABC transporter permease PstA [Jatrophihabitans sp.]|jgi:phosphate transport system permease protein